MSTPYDIYSRVHSLFFLAFYNIELFEGLWKTMENAEETKK